MADSKIKRSLNEVWADFVAVAKSLYKLMPAAVVTLVLVGAAVTAAAVWSSTIMIALVHLIVLFVSVVIYLKSTNYAEAALALVAGLLTVYSVSWTISTFISFVAVWIGFSCLTMLITSIRLAAKSESLYRSAALALAENLDDVPSVEAELRKIGDDRSFRGLGPIERAEALRYFAFRKLPIQAMSASLRTTANLSVVTEVELRKVTAFVADVYRIFEASNPADYTAINESLFASLRRSAVPPSDFLTAFAHSRHIALGGRARPDVFLNSLQALLETGIPPEAVAEHLQDSLSSS